MRRLTTDEMTVLDEIAPQHPAYNRDMPEGVRLELQEAVEQYFIPEATYVLDTDSDRNPTIVCLVARDRDGNGMLVGIWNPKAPAVPLAEDTWGTLIASFAKRARAKRFNQTGSNARATVAMLGMFALVISMATHWSFPVFDAVVGTAVQLMGQFGVFVGVIAAVLAITGLLLAVAEIAMLLTRPYQWARDRVGQSLDAILAARA